MFHRGHLIPHPLPPGMLWWLREASRRDAQAFGARHPLGAYTSEEDITAPIPSVPHAATSWMPKGYVMAMSADEAHSRNRSCSRMTQAGVSTGTTGTQCALGLVVSSSCQTCEEFPVLEVDDAQAAASETSTTLHDGADIMAETGPHTCSCHTGDVILFGGTLDPCLFCQQHNLQSAHVKVDVSDKMPHDCPVRKEVLLEKGCLDTHMTVHTGKPYICSICPKSFSKKRNLVSHERVHSGKKPYVCRVCQGSFTSRSNLVVHERVHSGEKPYVCRICQRSFTRRSHLGKHEKLHSGERPYMCRICQKSFARRDYLVYHERSHSADKPYMCSICRKSFSQKSCLIQHEKVHSCEKPYICSICQKGFSRRVLLVDHERSHSGEKPYVCSTCRRGFVNKRTLASHERLHSGEKPYTCSTCQKSFFQRRNLIDHERVHLCEKPYVCSICQKSFTLKKNLTRHERLHSQTPLCL